MDATGRTRAQQQQRYCEPRGRAHGAAGRPYEAPEIHCDPCRFTIEAELSALDGVRGVSVCVGERRVTVRGEAPDDSVRTTLAGVGYAVAGVHADG